MKDICCAGKATAAFLLACLAAGLLTGCGGLQLSPHPGEAGGSATQGVEMRSGAYKLLYSFKGSEDGKEPTAGMIDVGGTFYGTTNVGGNPSCYGKVAGCGTVFTITPQGKEHVLYRFRPAPSGVNPFGSGLIRVGSEFYGVTADGGIDCGSGCGTVFKLSPSGREQTLYRFKGNGADGTQPMASLVYVKGKLYGTTNGGGNPHHLGTVFEVTLSGSEHVLHSFQGFRDGANPSTALINVNGTLYGTTGFGGGARWCNKILGTGGCGTVFSMTTSGQEHIIYRFKGGRDGAIPSDSLTDIGGVFYGTTAAGGSSACTGGCGTIFELNPTSGRKRVVYRFKGGTDGYSPTSGLLYYRGMLYGTTPVGGTGNMGPCSISGYGNCGTLYRVSLSGGETVLHDFEGPKGDGNAPTGDLLELNGILYGVTALGGANCYVNLGCGTVYSFEP